MKAGYIATLTGAALLAGCTSSWDTSNTATADTRLARDTAIDADLHGPEVAAFVGAKPGETVIDLIPGRGYWTRTFARIVGSTGHVYGIWPKSYADRNAEQVQSYAQMIATPAFANTSALVQPAASAMPARVDVLFTANDYHGYAGGEYAPVGAAQLNKAAFDALKPGGTYVVIDHVAMPGMDAKAAAALERVDPALVRKQVTDAGFTFVGESRLLASADDDHSLSAYAPTVRGHSDQFILKFAKP